MTVSILLNDKRVSQDVAPDTTLLSYLRAAGMKSVKCGCETTNCGLCTVLLDGEPVLSCAVLAVRADGRQVTTLEGLQKEAELLGGCLADEGAEQCGFCNPGLLVNAIALLEKDTHPSEQKIRDWLEGNLCRCSGYEGQLRAMKRFFERYGTLEGGEGGVGKTKNPDASAQAAGGAAGASAQASGIPADAAAQAAGISVNASAQAADITAAAPKAAGTGRSPARSAFPADRNGRPFRSVGKPIRKKDAMQLVTGQPVYLEDVVPDDYLVVKLLRSPYANAIVEDIQTDAALRLPGIAAVYTWKDVPQDGERFTLAGQTYPEISPCDRLIIDRHVRFCGDTVAIVAGENERCVNQAMKLIRVKYQVLEPVLDPHKAKDNAVLVHPEENWVSQVPCGADARRNLCASGESAEGDLEGTLRACDVVVDHVFHTQACQQAMMETFRTYCRIDSDGRLDVISSTQIVFHCRRIVARALGIPKSMVRVRKPRIGGGFGAKQTAVSEIYPAFVTWKLKKPSMIIFTREESQTASSPRHEMEIHCRLGGMKDGKIRAIDLYTLSNTGAYGEHGPTTVDLSGHKSIPLYTDLDAFRFAYDVVYTNIMSAGAFRGYGAPQGTFAVESCVNEFAERIGMDPIAVRLKNMVRQGDLMPAYDGTVLTSCTLDRCVETVRDMIRWNEKYPARIMPDGKIRAVGIGMCMQGSGIAGVDVGSAAMKLNDDGFYTLRIGAADMGTGCDTTMAQVAAEVLECSPDRVVTAPVDTDSSPYDSGSYASSTAYVTGKAVERCALELREKIVKFGAEKCGIPEDRAEFDGNFVYDREEPEKKIGIGEIAYASQCANNTALEAAVSNSSPISPPPFMAGAAEVEVDPETGKAKVLEFDACVDCGTPLNENLARVQAEGGLLQGIGMTLTEQVSYLPNGRMRENSFLQYKIPTRNDFGHIRVEIAPSYEESGPFGAKSIGEVVLSTPLPAVTHALHNATGGWFRTLPVKPEEIAEACRRKAAAKRSGEV